LFAKAEAERLKSKNQKFIEFIEQFTKKNIQDKYQDLLFPKPADLNQSYYDGSQYISSKRSTDEKLHKVK